MNPIAKIRKQHNYTQAQLAQMLNVHQTAVSQWEQGRTLPDIMTAQKLAVIFGVTIDELINGSGYIENEGKKKDGEITDEQLKYSIFSTTENVTDEMLNKVREYAKFLLYANEH